jgi:deoxyadenosine/deoxycytidine kinase
MVEDESIGDTLIDMANYALICHILFYEKRYKELNENTDNLTKQFLDKRMYKDIKEHGNDMSFENESRKHDT